MTNLIDLPVLISQYGFPIVAYLLLYLDLRKIIQKNTEAINGLLALLEKK